MGTDKTMFKIGEMVFAKVRGHPPWPARITSLIDGRPNNYKYGVYFFGTAETAAVSHKDICFYKENKDKLGKPGKRKLFKEGLEQIEVEIRKIENGEESTVGLLSEGTPVVTQKEHKKKTKKTDGSQFEDCNYQVAEFKESERGRGCEEYQEMGRGTKKIRSKGEVAEGAAKLEQERSRSGRVIKPKKFLDEENGEDENKSRNKPQPSTSAAVPSPPPSGTGRKGKAPERARARESAKAGKSNLSSQDMGRIMWAKTKCGQVVQIKLDWDRPATFKDDRARLMWERATEINAKRLKSEIEAGEITRAYIKRQLKPTEEEKAKLTAKELFEMKRSRIIERKRGRMRWLKLETRLVHVDVAIKNCLRRSKVDIDKALPLMDELINLPLDPLMLKKHPEVVDTTERLRHYIGNTKGWNYSEEETKAFDAKALKVREKANSLFKKYACLFAVQETSNFWSSFLEAVDEFSRLTRDMSRERVLGLIIDPSSPYFQDVCEDDQEEEEFKLKYNINAHKYLARRIARRAGKC